MGRAHAVGLWLCVLGGLAACPEVHRPDGKLDRAAHKDALELIQKSICSEEDYRLLCPDDAEPSKECITRCGGS
ncbi:Secreted protein [Corallococcus exiguus]